MENETKIYKTEKLAAIAAQIDNNPKVGQMAYEELEKFGFVNVVNLARCKSTLYAVEINNFFD
jgi:DNA-binding transcriptional regulator YhcF (GntR family)